MYLIVLFIGVLIKSLCYDKLHCLLLYINVMCVFDESTILYLC